MINTDKKKLCRYNARQYIIVTVKVLKWFVE